MQTTAKLIEILPLQTGTSKNGEWKKQDMIFETMDQYPKKICISFWGDKIPENLVTQNTYTIDFNIESREYNGRWYTDVKGWRITSQQENADDIPEVPLDDSFDFPIGEDDDIFPF